MGCRARRRGALACSGRDACSQHPGNGGEPPHRKSGFRAARLDGRAREPTGSSCRTILIGLRAGAEPVIHEPSWRLRKLIHPHPEPVEHDGGLRGSGAFPPAAGRYFGHGLKCLGGLLRGDTYERDQARRGQRSLVDRSREDPPPGSAGANANRPAHDCGDRCGRRAP